MKYAVIAQRFEDASANKLLEKLNDFGVKTLKITFTVDGKITDVGPGQFKTDSYNLFTLTELLTDKAFDPKSCVFYDITNPPLLVNNEEQYSRHQPPPIALYNLQIWLIQEAIRFKCSKYIRIGCNSEKLMAQHLAQDWAYSEFAQYDSLETIYRIASRDMSKLLAYIGKVDFINARLSAIVDTNNVDATSIAAWLQEYSAIRKEVISIDAVSADKLAEILADLGFNGKNKTDAYIGSNSFYCINQLITFLNDKSQGLIADVKPDGANAAENELIATTSAFKH